MREFKRALNQGAAVIGLVGALALATAPSGAAAQTASAPEGASGDTGVAPAEADIPDITITGSRIQGRAPVGSSVISVDRKDLAESGTGTLNEVLRQVPGFSGLGLGEGSRANQGGNINFTGVSAANLRGLGPTATLTLMNSHRLPVTGIGGLAVDLSEIPTVAVGRVEVLTDGASAVYGSDAVAGVVNAHLRSDLDGFEVNARMGVADNYYERRFGAAAGKKWDGGFIFGAVESNWHSDLAGLDRKFNRQNLTGLGGGDFSTTFCSPGNAVVNGTLYPVNSNGTIGTGAANRCEPNAQNDLLPESRRTSAVVNFSHEVAPGLTVFGDGLYIKRHTDTDFARVSETISLPQNNPFFQLPPGVALASLPTCAFNVALRCLTVQLDPTTQFGGPYRRYTSSTESYTLHGGAKYRMFADWDLTGSVTYGHDNSSYIGPNRNLGLLTTAVRSTSAATAFDPFGTRTNAGVIAGILDYSQRGDPRSRLTDFEVDASGTLLSLPGGPLKAAVGAEHRKETYSSENIAASAASTVPRVGTSRTVKAVYGEINVPIFGPDNATAGFQRLDLSAALRYEHYSDFGSTTNPKIGVSWEPVSGFTLRGSYSTSFHAPTPNDLVGTLGGTAVYLPVTSPAGGTVQTLQINSGNPGLSPETSTNWSFGFDVGRALIPGLKLGATYFRIDYKNQIISQFNNPNVLLQADQFASVIQLNPTAADLAAVGAVYPIVNTPGGPVGAIIDGRPFNLGSTKLRGFDLDASYSFETQNAGRFNLSLVGTYYTKYAVAAGQGQPVNRIDEYGYPVDFQLRGGLGWDWGNFSAATFINYTDSYRDGTAKVASDTTVDLFLSLRVGEAGERSFRGGYTFSINVNNLFDKDPPFVNRAAYVLNPGGYDPNNASPIGRLISVSASKSF